MAIPISRVRRLESIDQRVTRLAGVPGSDVPSPALCAMLARFEELTGSAPLPYLRALGDADPPADVQDVMLRIICLRRTEGTGEPLAH